MAEMTENDKRFYDFGRVVWQAAWVESAMRQILSKLKGRTRDEIIIEYAKRGASVMIEDIITEIENRYSPSERRQLVLDHLKHAADLFEFRNAYVHGLHYIDGGRTWQILRVTNSKVKGKKQAVVRTMIITPHFTDQLSTHLSDLRRDLQHDLESLGVSINIHDVF